MDEAIIKRHGRGWQLTFIKDNKTMPVNWSNIPENWDKERILVKRISGLPVRLDKGNETITNPNSPHARTQSRGSRLSQMPNQNSNSHQNQHNVTPQNSARAPYNFVPINDKIVTSNGIIDHSIFNELSGYISLELEVKQPLFIRGKGADFYRINDTFTIPGSTLRGLTRNIMNILSFANFEQFDTKKRAKKIWWIPLVNLLPVCNSTPINIFESELEHTQ